MIPIIAVLGDLHLGNKGQSLEVFEYQMKFIETQFFPYILENNIKYVIQLGDCFHDRNKTDWCILNESKKRIFNWFDENGVELHAIVGNHDTYFKSSLEQNSLTETTKYFKNVHVYTEPTKVMIGRYTIGFNPWILDYKNHNLTKKVDILVGHLDVKTFPMMKGIYAKEGLEVSQLSEYKLVISGHYHSREIKDNVHMCGSPFQLGWGEWNQPRGFAVIDNNFNIEYIQNEVNPQFVKLYYNNGEISVQGLNYTDTQTPITKQESLEIVKKNYCRLFTKQVDDQMNLETYHVSLLAVSCDDYKIDIMSMNDVVEDLDLADFDEKFEEGESTLQLIMSCIEGMTFEHGIDKVLLLELSKEEYRKAYDEVLVGDE
jgi:DNA repair exonuclease SbcCD nuclease subunit